MTFSRSSASLLAPTMLAPMAMLPTYVVVPRISSRTRVRTIGVAILAQLLFGSMSPAYAATQSQPAQTNTAQPPPAPVSATAVGGSSSGQRATTPIIPQPARRAHRAYQLYWEVDLPVLGVAAVLGATRMARTESAAPAFCVQQIAPQDRATVPCDPSELNWLDRRVAGRWSPRWATTSDLLRLGLGVVPVVALWVDQGFLNMVNDLVVIYQSALIAASLSGLSSISAGRGRPYVYGTAAPVETRTSPEGALAFFSGHASMAFALSTSTFWTFQRTHRDGPIPWIVLGVGTAGATGVAVARVMAGRHFPTDVLAGAVVGLGIGTLIPMMHGLPVQIVPEMSGHRQSVSVIGAF